MSTSSVTVALKIDVSGFIKATRNATYGLRNLALAIQGQPIPPRQRVHFDGTAREYRAARRAYSREVRTHRKAKG